MIMFLMLIHSVSISRKRRTSPSGGKARTGKRKQKQSVKKEESSESEDESPQPEREPPQPAAATTIKEYVGVSMVTVSAIIANEVLSTQSHGIVCPTYSTNLECVAL